MCLSLNQLMVVVRRRSILDLMCDASRKRDRRPPELRRAVLVCRASWFSLFFSVEFILAAVVVGLVSIAETVVRHRWTCRVTDPAGRVFSFRARGMRRARRLRDEMADATWAGDAGVLQEVDGR